MEQATEPVVADRPNGESVKKQNEKPSYVAWHPAFVEAIKLELEEYEDVLEFYPEYQLTTEPLRIDCIIIIWNIPSTFHGTMKLQYGLPKVKTFRG